jgi:hypothetical protein
VSIDAGALPPKLQALIDAEVALGERVLWQARPVARFQWGSLPLLLFGVPWTAFAVFWIWKVSQAVRLMGPAGMLAPLFGVPFVLVGLGLLSSPWWLYALAGRTAYVITDKRAIILAPSWRGRSVRSFAPERIEVLERRERADGSGDLVFEKSYYSDSDGDRRAREIGFMNVPDVRLVERMVGALAESARQPQP